MLEGAVVAQALASPALRNGAAWMATSLVFSTYSNTAFLHAGGSGLQLTLVRFIGSVLLGYLQQLFGALPAAPLGFNGGSNGMGDLGLDGLPDGGGGAGLGSGVGSSSGLAPELGAGLPSLTRSVGGVVLSLGRVDRAALLAGPLLVKKHARAYARPALALLTANFCNSVALKRTGITITYVTKCIIPIATGLLCLLGLGPAPPRKFGTIAGMAVLCSGIAAASAGNGSFELFGFLAALVSAFAQSFLTVFSKAAYEEAGLSGPQAQFVMATLALSILETTRWAKLLWGFVMRRLRKSQT
uniref:Sugar phosphate transporter domain-containing protein n=1 Tax=Phaeomonas parva TaxID=124430 RepID=A0A7S1UB46_9STRA